jgi:hypothetical protein
MYLKEHHNTLIIILLLMVVPLIDMKPIPQVNDGVKYENVIAVYIYNFTKLMRWPQKSMDNFCISIIGKNNVAAPLHNIAGKEKVNGKSIVVNEIYDLNDLGSCNILFLSQSEKSRLNEIIKKIKGKNILLITDINGSAEKGAGINFIQLGDKVKFEINRNALEEEGIIPNSTIFSLAYRVYE